MFRAEGTIKTRETFDTLDIETKPSRVLEVRCKK